MRRLVSGERLACLAAVVLAVACSWNTVGGSFVFDDFGLVVGNPEAVQGASAWTWFSKPSTTGSLYRPLTMISYEANAALGGTQPYGYHVLNVCLHALATLAAFAFARVLFGAVWPAAAVALVFAVHPVHTEPVANVAGRAELLAGMFVLTSLWALLRAVPIGRRIRPGWLALAVVLAFLGMLSKESATTVVLLAALTLFCRPRQLSGGARGLLVLPFAAAAALYLALRWHAVGSLGLLEPPPYFENPLAHVDLWQRLGTAIVVLGEYVSTLTLPLRLAADESFDQMPLVSSMADPRLLLTLALAIGFAVLLTRSPRARWTTFGALFFLGALAVTANVLMPIGTIKAERLLYLPSFGWCVLLAAVLVRLESRQRTAALLLIVGLFGARTMARNLVWRDSLSLFEANVADSPNSARAHSNVAAVYAGMRRYDDALWHYQQAATIRPDFVPAQLGVGHLMRKSGHIPEALAAYRAAAAGASSQEPWRGHLALGDLLVQGGDLAGAQVSYTEGVEVAPGNVELMLALAVTQAQRGDDAAAEAIRDQFAAVAGQNPRLQSRLAALDRALAN